MQHTLKFLCHCETVRPWQSLTAMHYASLPLGEGEFFKLPA